MEYQNNAGCPASDSRKPDFQEILESFREEVSKYTSAASDIEFFSRQLKQMDDSKKESMGLVNKEPTSVIDNIWHQIWNLRNLNERMEAVALHLKFVIGS